ncbi:MAG: hypothetical protein OXC28_00705 [Defluviicoccus sp.]|nr:hypothetical protein [Defluviicoccus sp.]
MSWISSSRHTQTSSFDFLFDFLVLAHGNTDLFVVAPEETVEHVKGWLRLWLAIPNAVAGRKPLGKDLMIVIDELPRIGFLKPVIQAGDGRLHRGRRQVIPLHDPTGGWRGHIRDNYGRTIVDCVTDAMRTNAEIGCQLVVRRP